MARTNKKGIDYFPFDVDFFQDDKIQLIEAEFGVKGSIIAIRLLCKIYNEGYYYQWGGDGCLLFARNAGAEFVPNAVEEVVKGLVRRCFFDKGCFDRFSILTSKGIQERYFEATKRYKSVNVIGDFLLVDVSKMDNVSIIKFNDSINPINDDINPQKKRNKKKRNNIPPIPPFGGIECDQFSFDDFWNQYDKKVGDKDKIRNKWEKLHEKERLAIMEYIPKYKKSQPIKQYRKNPSTFLNNKSWNDELIGENAEYTNDMLEKDIANTSEAYKSFRRWMFKNAPYCGNPNNFSFHISEKQFSKLKDLHDSKTIAEVVKSIDSLKNVRCQCDDLHTVVVEKLKRIHGAK